MDAICRAIAAEEARRKTPPMTPTESMGPCPPPCWGPLSREELRNDRLAIQALWDLGWVLREDRPEPHPFRTHLWPDRIHHPWWADPVSGEDVFGVYNAMRVAFDRYMGEVAHESLAS